MTVAAAPHPPSVFLYLKQAWREYLTSHHAATLTIATPASQPAANPLTSTGTLLVDASVPKPVAIRADLLKAGAVQMTLYTYADKTTGVWTVVFPGGTSTASATAQVAAYATMGDILLEAAASPNFTLT